MSTSLPVLIVGAGPTGLVLALWLARLNVPVRIIDKSIGPGETSRAIIMHARSLEFYRQLGIAEDVVQHGMKVERISVVSAGTVKGSIPLGELGSDLSYFPFVLSFPQDEHEKLLIKHLKAAGVTVERQTELVDYEQLEDSVSVTVRNGKGKQDVYMVSYVAGCDGARSTVRQLAGLEMEGGTYPHRFYVADVEIDEVLGRNQVNVCLTNQDFCIWIPLHRPGGARLIGTVPDALDTDGIGFEDVRASVRQNAGLEVNHVEWFATYNVHHRVAEKFRDRRVFLLGDAAHLHSPAGGQGMNTGLGDASNLAWKLAAVYRGAGAPELLDTYELERIKFARTLVNTTDFFFSLVTNSGLSGWLTRACFIPYILPLAFRVPLLAKMAFSKLSQIEITYSASPLSDGSAGRVKAGDRLPWVMLDDGSDNHDPLSALAWQLHWYGAAVYAPTAAERRGLPLHIFPWSPAVKAAGLDRDSLYLIRPDGHIGLVQTRVDVTALDSYLERWRITGV